MRLGTHAWIVIGCALALSPLAAFADPPPPPGAQVEQMQYPPQYQNDPYPSQYQYQQPGHYELRVVSQWVPASFQEITVPGRCWGRRRWWRRFCQPAHLERRWVPAHYQSLRQWVWVANPAPTYPAPDRDGDYDYDD